MAIGLARRRHLRDGFVQLQQTVGLSTLYHIQAILPQPVALHSALSCLLCCCINLASHRYNAKRIALDTIRNHLCARLCQFVLDETAHIMVEEALPDNRHRHHSSRQHRQQHDHRQDAVGTPLTPRRHKRMAVEAQQANTKERRKGDKNRIDEEQIERTEEIQQVPCG